MGLSHVVKKGGRHIITGRIGTQIDEPPRHGDGVTAVLHRHCLEDEPLPFQQTRARPTLVDR
jgi:hypothetical protein